MLATAQNHLIELLPSKDRLRLLAACEPVELVLAEVLCNAGEPTRHVYFPTEGFISLVATVAAGNLGVELGMVGSEGMLGAEMVLGVATSPLHALVQGQGRAWRISVRAFRGELARSAALRQLLNRYLYVLMAQQAASAACLRFHLIGPRLARWLLMSRDRAHSDRFHVTHEFLAYMLGMRRVGITIAASALQRSGLIEYRRGELQVLDRSGLEAVACGCYATDRQSYATLLADLLQLRSPPQKNLTDGARELPRGLPRGLRAQRFTCAIAHRRKLFYLLKQTQTSRQCDGPCSGRSV